MVWLAPSYIKYEATIQEGVMNFMRLFLNLERVNSSKHDTRNITQMMQMNETLWSLQEIVKPDTLNPEPVSGITSMCVKHVNHSDEWFYMESMNLVSEDLVKLTLGGLILGDCVDLCGHVPDDWRVSAGCHEKGQQDSHVKRVMTNGYLKEDQSEFLETERRHKNLSHRLKVNEFASLMRQSSCPGTKGDKPNNV